MTRSLTGSGRWSVRLAERIADRLREISGQGIAPIALFFALLFALQATHLALSGPRETMTFSMFLLGGAALAYLAKFLLFSVRQPTGELAHPIAMLVFIIAPLTWLLHQLQVQTPVYLTYLLLIIVSGGMLFLSRVWFTLAMALSLTVWTVAGLKFYTVRDWETGVPQVAAAVIMSITSHYRRRSVLMRLAAFRARDEDRKRRLQEQVESASRSSAHLAELSVRDPLTGAYNRRYLDVVQLELERPTAFWGLILIDLDDFKTVNDRYGHEEGDRVLQRLAHFVRRQGRAEDRLIRLGGDEFVFIVDAPSESELERISDRLLSAAKSEAPTRFSVGVAYRQPGESVRDVLQRADGLMYEHKVQNRLADSGGGGTVESIERWRRRS